MKKTLAFGLLISLLAGASVALSAQVKVDYPPAIEVRLACSPEVAKVGGKKVLAYELHLRNFQDVDFQIQKVEALDEHGVVRLSLQGEQLLQALQAVPRTAQPPKDSHLAPGASAIVYMWIEAENPPKSLHHELTVVSSAGEKIARSPEVPLSTRKPLQIALPFKTPGTWVAASGPSNSSVHRRALQCTCGDPLVSQRFAIDWILLASDTLLTRGALEKNENHPCFNQPAIAVADAKVAAIYDGIPLNIPGPLREIVITPKTIGGNWVGLDLGEGRYAMYAHLIPGSIRVRPGQSVKLGEEVARIGNTGNSDAPHLHFHVADRPDWVVAEGLPYRFPSFVYSGKCTVGDDLPKVNTVRVPDRVIYDEMPAEDVCIEVKP